MNNSFSADYRNHSFSLIKNKKHSHNPINSIQSTRYNSQFINPQDMKIRLPSLDLIKNKSNTSILIQRSTKIKVSSLQTMAQQLSMEIHNTRLDAKQTRDNIYCIKKLFIQQTLASHQKDLKQKVNALQKLVTLTKKNNEQRSNDLRQGYINLWNQTEYLKQMVFDLTMRMDQIDDSMGYQNNNISSNQK